MPLSHARLWAALDALAQREGLSVSGLAKRAGLDATALNPSKRFGPGRPPRPRWPSTESLNQILEATGVSLGAFAALAGDAPDPARTIPLLGLAQAGADGFFDDAGLPTGDGWDQTDLPAPRDSLFSLVISGDSMAPLYREGDRVLVDRDRTDVRKGDRVVVRTLSGETVAKEIAGLGATAVTLASINPAYPDRVVARADIDWVARILWVSQ
ncbi:peptidase S24 [Brevundimonas sp. LM2]|uniref:S24 family peptidase n=1 Tax=Brevundimonas sp. LM2 TaxID=1938605 RepID=UPI000983FA63|nr:helix-turn-helix transcriptional regulator [Brevundimonas sp. LM2]AQR61552.1 peptidase S24 [Brevundimonas sp. LM2]